MPKATPTALSIGPAGPGWNGAKGTTTRQIVQGTAVISMNTGAWNRNSMTLTSDDADINTLSTRPAGPPAKASMITIAANMLMLRAQPEMKARPRDCRALLLL